jgi:hypothetical protein
MSLDQHSTPPAGPQGYYAAPPQPQPGRSGLAIAGLVFAFLAAPVGFVLSLIAIFKTGSGRRKGRGMAIAGVIISVLIMAGTTTLVVAAANSTLADPGCAAGKAAVLEGSDNLTDAGSLQTTIDDLNAAAAKATHDNVRAAMKALAEDYTQLLKGTKTGEIPPGILDKVVADAKTIDSLCTIGG